eukprot:15454086-Alexandrium_andersonii.AAC.1
MVAASGETTRHAMPRSFDRVGLHPLNARLRWHAHAFVAETTLHLRVTRLLLPQSTVTVIRLLNS